VSSTIKRRLPTRCSQPGQGKTMLMFGIVDILSTTSPTTDLLSYFFCQTSSDPRYPPINKATAVLRGLIHHLVTQRPSLVCHVRLEYDRVGKRLFTDINAWTALSRILNDIMEDPELNKDTTYLVVDAIDVCIDPTDRKSLLELIVRTSAQHSNIKWVVTSRGWTDIRDVLEEAPVMVRLRLDPESDAIVNAVKTYIRHKVEILSKKKMYDQSAITVIENYLSANAGGTFLWVALVCKNLEETKRMFYTEAMQAFPPGLGKLYGSMLQRIQKLEVHEANLYMRILTVVSTVFRPLDLRELGLLAEELEQYADDKVEMRDVVSNCGSFFSEQNGKVYFVHLSAREYLSKEACQIMFPNGQGAVHFDILTRSRELLTSRMTMIRELQQTTNHLTKTQQHQNFNF
jgi:hypothetical protein